MPNRTRHCTIKLGVSHEIYAEIEQAAWMNGKTVEDFVSDAASRSAHRSLECGERIRKLIAGEYVPPRPELQPLYDTVLRELVSREQAALPNAES